MASQQNKKQAVILYGSPHKNGHTKKVLDSLLLDLANDYEFNLIDAYKEHVKPCTDCKFCKKTPRCIFPDFDNIDLHIRAADLIILASPVYNLSFPAPLKAIIDRMQLYYNMKTKLKINPFKKRKKAILVITYGSQDKACEELILKQTKLLFILLNAQLCKTIFIKNTDKN